MNRFSSIQCKRMGLLNAILVALSLGACGDSGLPVTGLPDARIARIDIAPDAMSFSWLGEEIQVTAKARDQQGAALPEVQIAWTSSNPEVAEVTAQGRVRAMGNGQAQIRAAAGGVENLLPVTVSQVPYRLQLNIGEATLDLPGDTSRVTADLRDAGGALMSTDAVGWHTTNSEIVSIANGLITAVGPGSAVISASLANLRAEAGVFVGGTHIVIHVWGDGDPLPAVDVWRIGPSGDRVREVTDENGRAVFRRVIPAVHEIAIQGFPTDLTVARSKVVSVQAESVTEVTFDGQYPRAIVSGSLLSWGEPVAGAVITISGKDTITVTSDSMGLYQSDPVRRGPSMLSVTSYDTLRYRFREDSIIADLASGPSEINFIARPLEDMIWTQVSAGSQHACGLTPDGAMYCWGSNVFDRLGNALVGRSSSVPVRVGADRKWKQVSAGGSHTCALTEDGTPYCWGSNLFGQLGSGTHFYVDARTPTRVTGGLRFGSISAGFNAVCGVSQTGDAHCWGNNHRGQLGLGSNGGQRNQPGRLSQPTTWTTVIASGAHTCGITPDQTGYCWGLNEEGQVGNGSTLRGTGIAVPQPIVGSYAWRMLTTGAYHSCGITRFDELYCWGRNSTGQLGDGSTDFRTRPTPVAGDPGLVVVSGGGFHTCGLTAAGLAYCWGDNRAGGLGDGTTESRSAPTRVTTDLHWGALSAGNGFTCGLTLDREIHCWGSNRDGTLGDGSQVDSRAPVRVGGDW